MNLRRGYSDFGPWFRPCLWSGSCTSATSVLTTSAIGYVGPLAATGTSLNPARSASPSCRRSCSACCCLSVEYGRQPWGRPVLARAVIDSYLAHARNIGVSRRAGEMAVGRMLAELVPGFAKARTRNGSGPRAIHYAFPTLDECRRAFLEYLGLSQDEIDSFPWPMDIVAAA